MAAFGYEAIDKSGRVVKGSIDAETLDYAKLKIKGQELTLLEIKEQGLFTKDLNIEIGGYPKPRDLSIFCRQFVAMTRSGVTILESLKLLEEQTECKQLKLATEGVRTNVEKGETLAESFALYPKVFPSLMVSMVQAGEASGSLDVALDRMATQFERTAKTQALIKKAMIYPVVVGVVAVAMIVVMLTVVLPKYEDMFLQLGTDLPGITVAMVTASDFLVNNWIIIVPVVIGVIILLRMWGKTDSGKHFFHKLKLKIPAIKQLEVKQASSLMSRTLSTLMAAGVPLVEAVDIVTNVMGNVYFKEAMEKCHDEIVIGQPLSVPLEDSGLFPPMVYHMTKIGEESGKIEEMLTKVADYYDDEIESSVQSMMAALEPMIIIVLAGIVGLLVAACFAPMLKMYDALGNL